MLLPLIDFLGNLFDLFGQDLLLVAINLLLGLDPCDFVFFLVQHVRVLAEDRLLGFVLRQLCLERLFYVFPLVFQIEDSPEARRVHHFRLNRVNIFEQECDALALLSNLVFVVSSLQVLLIDNHGLLLSHQLQL